MTRVIVDAFGGDNAPLEVVKGARQAVDELGVTVILTGDRQKIEDCAKAAQVSLTGIEIEQADDVMPVNEEPTKLLKQYKNSSMAVGFALLTEGKGDAFVSAGSTGALAVGSTFIAKRIKGIKRAAIAACIPNEKGAYLLADSGANTECRPEMLRQFALMGSVYMQKVYGIERPRVGLINIGTEDNKGGDLQVEANKLLRETPGICYVGNVEARELPLGGCDVAVCDGFTGNIILKLSEGMGKMFKNQLKGMFLASFATKLGALLVAGQMKNFKDKFDYKEHGGAMLLGVRKPVIKAHGSSDAKAMKNAIRQAKQCHEGGIIPTIEKELAAIGAAESDGEE